MCYPADWKGWIGLPQPALGILIIAKHLYYAGREEFNFAQVEEEYLRFSRTKLVGSGKVRWSLGVLRMVSLAFCLPACAALPIQGRVPSLCLSPTKRHLHHTYFIYLTCGTVR